MIRFKKSVLKGILTVLVFGFLVGCSSPSAPSDSTTKTPPSSSVQTTDNTKELLLEMKQLAEQGKVINSDFSVKTTVIEDVKKKWGEPDKIDWVPAAKGNYATYSSRAIVFGFNKGSQIFEVRSFDEKLQNLSFEKTQEIFGTPAYDVNVNGEKIIGYTAGQEYKIELVFPQPTSSNPNPVVDHYLVLYPKGTVNSMANDPGRQW